MTNCVGAPDEQLEEKELLIADLEERIESLEKENFQIRQEMQKAPSMVGKTGKDESEKVINDLSKQNAILRRKLDDALEKLSKK